MTSVSNLISHISRLKYHAIVVAGGTGSRMQSTLPKQFLLLNGKPVLMHTIETFHNSQSKPAIILVLHGSYHVYWAELCEQYTFEIPHTLVAGGETRFHSVKNGLDAITGEDGLVAVHDSVRPLTSGTVIDLSFQQAAIHGNAITAIKSRDSVRQLNGDISVALPRESIYLIQTPQTFRLDIMRKAYQQPYNDHFTDDASVIEHYGERIHLIEGDDTNIKITFPADIAIAETILNKKPSA